MDDFNINSSVLPKLLYNGADELYAIPPALWESATGAFNKRVLVIYLEENDVEQDKAFLQKILQSVQIDLQKDALSVGLKRDESARCIPFPSDKHPEAIMVFGISPGQLGLSLSWEKYQVTHFYQTNWLISDSLHTLQPDKQLKAKLWQALKGIFDA